MIGPLGLPDQLPVQHQLLLAKEREHRGHVDELDPQPLGGADDPAVARADVGAPRLLAVAEAAHRVDAAAHPILRLHDLDARAMRLEMERGGESGKPGADDDDVAPVPGGGQRSALRGRGAAGRTAARARGTGSP